MAGAKGCSLAGALWTLMRDSQIRRRLWLAAAGGLFALVWTGVLAQSHLSGAATILDRIENFALDLRILAIGARPAPSNVVIVAIDDETVREAGRFPLPRSALAELLRQLSGLGAAAIAFDVLFIDPGPPDEDMAFAKSLHQAKAVIAAAGVFNETASSPELRSRTFQVVDRVAWPIDQFRDAAAVGIVNITTDDSGTPRHVPLLLRTDDGFVPSFALRTATRAKNPAVVIDGDSIVISGIASRTDLGLNLPLRFYGPGGTIPTISARAVLHGHVDREAIAGKTVVVGATALGTSDTFATPFDPIFPGVEVLATAISHLLSGDGLVRDREIRRTDVFAALFLASSAVLLIAFAPLGPALVAAGLGTVSWLAITLLALGHGYWFSAAVPSCALILPAMLCAAGRQLLDRRQARYHAHAERELRRFQPPQLADRIVSDPAFLALPERRSIPILFVDLSNFTRLSERLGPGETRELLREFHGIVEEAVTSKGGLVLTFMGDGAMIAFGLPDSKLDDAQRAVEAAVGLAKAVRAWLVAKSLDSLDVRVGAHYGPVALSRLGTDTHQHITAAGDSVNVTSRMLEVAAAEKAPVVASAELLRAAGPVASALHFAEMKVVDIRGRGQPLTLATWQLPA